MRTPQNYVKNADTTEAYFNKSHLLRRVRFNNKHRVNNLAYLEQGTFLKFSLRLLVKTIGKEHGHNRKPFCMAPYYHPSNTVYLMRLTEF